MLLEWREHIKALLPQIPGGERLGHALKTVLFHAEKRYYYPPSQAPRQPGSLREFHLELNSACNLRCQYCALDHAKPRVWMPLTLLDQALTELSTHPLFGHLEYLNLYNGGETLLHPKRLEAFALIAKHKSAAQARGKRFPKVVLLTNGMLLRPALTDALLALDAVDIFQFSMDGGSKEAFENLRTLAQWEPFVANLRYLRQQLTATRSTAAMKSITIVPDPHPLNTQWMDPAFREVLSWMQHRELRRLHDWSGQVDIGTPTGTSSAPRSCTLMLHQMVLLPTGDVSVCCSDLNGQGVLGRFPQQSLAEIYASPERRNYLELLGAGRRDELELCKGCSMR
jgi:sulfatase maturation enzyme AslB (radical SAM superfamily)